MVSRKNNNSYISWKFKFFFFFFIKKKTSKGDGKTPSTPWGEAPMKKIIPPPKKKKIPIYCENGCTLSDCLRRRGQVVGVIAWQATEAGFNQSFPTDFLSP